MATAPPDKLRVTKTIIIIIIIIITIIIWNLSKVQVLYYTMLLLHEM